MYKKKISMILLVSLMGLSMVVVGCSNQFSSDPGVPVTITPTLNGKALLEGIDSIELNVTGPGMEQIEESIEVGENSVTIEVPSGERREFNIDISTSLVTFSGSVVEDLTAGEEEEITIPLDLSEIKMLIPDAENSRIVKIDDMTGAGWVTSDFGLGASFFRPWDIDFDSQGKVYIADNRFGTGGAVIYRVGGLNDITPSPILTDIDGYKALAIDRNNEILYFAKSSNLWKANLDGSNKVTLDILTDSISNINGLEVMDNGYLLIAQGSATGDGRIDVYDPEGNGGVGASVQTINHAFEEGEKPNDFVYKNGYAYLAKENASGSILGIIRYDVSTSYQLSNPVVYDTDVTGPKRFIRTLSDEIIFINEFTSLADNRIISIEDINGTGRSDYGTLGTGQGEFDFFISEF